MDRIRQQYIQHIDIAEALQDGGHVFMVNGAGILRDIVSIHNEFGRDEGIMLSYMEYYSFSPSIFLH